MLHGHGEHSGRYAGFALAMSARGYSTYAFDWRGHGLSEGQRGHAGSFDDLTGDARLFIEEVRRAQAGEEVLPLGHSVGGSILLSAIVRSQVQPRRFAVSSPALRVRAKVPQWKLAAAGALSRLAPKVALATDLETAAISREPAVVEAYEKDPLVHSRMTARLYAEWSAANAEIMSRAGEIKVPFFASHGTDDRIIDPLATEEFYKRTAIAGSVLKLYAGSYHEPFNDLDREQVFSDLATWVG